MDIHNLWSRLLLVDPEPSLETLKEVARCAPRLHRAVYGELLGREVSREDAMDFLRIGGEIADLIVGRFVYEAIGSDDEDLIACFEACRDENLVKQYFYSLLLESAMDDSRDDRRGEFPVARFIRSLSGKWKDQFWNDLLESGLLHSPEWLVPMIKEENFKDHRRALWRFYRELVADLHPTSWHGAVSDVMGLVEIEELRHEEVSFFLARLLRGEIDQLRALLIKLVKGKNRVVYDNGIEEIARQLRQAAVELNPEELLIIVEGSSSSCVWAAQELLGKHSTSQEASLLREILQVKKERGAYWEEAKEKGLAVNETLLQSRAYSLRFNEEDLASSDPLPTAEEALSKLFIAATLKSH